MDLSNWRDIVSINACSNSDFAAGLRADGTVTACGRGFGCWYDLANWENIRQVDIGYILDIGRVLPGATPEGTYLVGLQEDGRVLFLIPDYSRSSSRYLDWSDIISVSASFFDVGEALLAGLKSDGSVVAIGTDDERIQQEISDWKDMVCIAVMHDDAVIGVHSDGTVEVAGRIDRYGGDDREDSLVKKIEEWTDVVEVFAWDYPERVVGLRSDGTVVAAGSNDHGECNVDAWHDIVRVRTGYNHTIGIDRDGKVWYSGDPPFEFQALFE